MNRLWTYSFYGATDWRSSSGFFSSSRKSTSSVYSISSGRPRLETGGLDLLEFSRMDDNTAASEKDW